ncbi:MAG: MipA/OmpV family protein [Lysobacteraceae bacterium]
MDSEWLLGERHRIVANVSYVRRGSEVEDSPLIDSASETSLTLGYVYEF